MGTSVPASVMPIRRLKNRSTSPFFPTANSPRF
jgi:hypothetical protein